MTRIEQAELQEIVSQLEEQEYFVRDDEGGSWLCNNPAFKRLKALATKERHPEGSDHLLSGKKDEELDIMQSWINPMIGGSVEAGRVIEEITKEKQRRLLAIIPKNS